MLRLMCANVEFRKSQAEVLEASLAKLIPKIAKPQSKADIILSQWDTDFETLRTKGYFQPGLEWKPIPDVRHSNKTTPTNEPCTSMDQFREVPNVIHRGWSEKDRTRAEVRHACMVMGDDMHLCLQQIQQEVARGPSTYSKKEIKRNEFVAICTENASENDGLPFWIGKVEKVEFRHVEDEDDEESSGSENDDVPLGHRHNLSKTSVQVKVKEFMQITKKKKGIIKNGDRTYHEAKPPEGSSDNSSYSWVPLSPIMYKFSNLTKSKSTPQNDANWIAYTAEIWLKSNTGTTPCGVEKMNTELGFKMVPQH